MKCLIVTTLERQILMFHVPHIQLLIEMGYEVTIAASIESEEKLRKRLPNVILYPLPFSRKIKSLSNVQAYLKLKRLLKGEQYDLIHVHSPIAAFLTRMAARKNQPLLYTAHGFHFHENGSKLSNLIFFLAEKMVASKTTKLIVMNKYDYKKGWKLYSNEKIHVIHGVGVDASFYNPKNFTEDHKHRLRESLGISAEKRVITHLAEFNENKRQVDIIEACELLKEKNQNFVTLLVGDGQLLKEMKAEIQNRGLTEFVHCLGFRTDINEILSITDIGLLVSLREGLPKSMMEMMAMEIPIVATRIRGCEELVEEEENGYLIPPKSPSELMNACLTLLEKDELRKYMGLQGRKRILEKYDLKIILREMRDIYEKIQCESTKNPSFLVRSESIKY